jgi:hypothetical protein
MKSCLVTFAAGLADLVVFLENSDRETDLVKHLLSEERIGSVTPAEKALLEEISKAATDKRRYVYATAIVGLYGLLERLVDSILEKYVTVVSVLVKRYEDLPDTIKRNHVALSIELVKAVNEERHRSDLTTQEIIGNLHACLSGADPFRVNGQAFVLHRGNLNLSKIREFLGKLGIDAPLRRILLLPTLEARFANEDPSRVIREIPDSDLEMLLAPIDDLVDRRNSVSHGVIDEIENVELLKDRCRFIEAFAQALHELLEQEVLRIELVHGSIQALGQPIEVYGKRVVCFESEKCKIAVGDRLAFATGDALAPYRWGQVINIEVDHTRYQALDITVKTQFGVEVGFRALKNHDYYLLGGQSDPVGIYD